MNLQLLHPLPLSFLLLFLTSITTATPHPQLPTLPPLISTPITSLITLSTLNDPPPAELQTKNPSEKCVAVNKGEVLCCAQQLDGRQPVVKEAAALLGYEGELNENSVNGFEFLFSGCLGLFMGGGGAVGRRGNSDMDIRNRELTIDIRIGVRESEEDTCPQGHYELCCQVTALVSFASLSIPS
ncbi:hypothetical protein CJF31_00007048 [Rutstroemia sp. NJR-2017a BVV2]|nr:hypothetical protein CJF31_00007048 [Rutstroemia sp. NJR-2017a BVV2]